MVLVKCLSGQTDQVSDNLMTFAAVDPVDRLVSGVGDLFTVFGEFNLGYELLCLTVHDSGQFIYAAKGRTAFGGDQVGSHTPGIDRCTLIL